MSLTSHLKIPYHTVYLYFLLIGSERLSLSGSEGDTLVETQNINYSLSMLGDVLSALSKNAKCVVGSGESPGSGKKGRGVTPMPVPVPYRNSKLTHLLKDSLGGNSKTVMIATVRVGGIHCPQTALTLVYASRARRIRNKSYIVRRTGGGGEGAAIAVLNGEIDMLRWEGRGGM